MTLQSAAIYKLENLYKMEHSAMPVWLDYKLSHPMDCFVMCFTYFVSRDIAATQLAMMVYNRTNFPTLSG